MFALIPLLFAVLISSSARHAEAHPFPVRHLGWMILALILWSGIIWLWARRLCRPGRSRLIPRYERFCSISLLGLHAWWSHALGWPPWDSTLVALVPFLLGLLIIWWCLSAIVRATAGTDQHPVGFVWLRIKLGVLPLLLAIALLDPVEWLLLHGLWLLDGLPPWVIWLTLNLAVVAMLVGVAIIIPPVLVRLWGARPLPPGHQREVLGEAIARSGVRVAHVLFWPTGTGRLFNAAAIGLVARWRYVLMTDRLLECLPDDQLRGVLGHELGHIRRRHLQLYLVFIMGASTWALLGTPWCTALARFIPGISALEPDLLDSGCMLAVWTVLLGGCFGALSRACERQADLEGVALCQDPTTMQSALASVARVTGTDPDTPSWRHHSIADRIDFLEQARLDPHLEHRHHRFVMKLRTVIWFFLILGLILVLTQAAGTRIGLEEQVARDPDLNRALLAAVEDDDSSLLQRWISHGENFERIAYAQMVMDFYRKYQFQADERKLRAYIPYLMPFRQISTDNATWDRRLKNIIAYALVAGSAPPSAEDLAILQDMLNVLVAYHEQAERDQDEIASGLADTIGCIHFVLGHHDAAADYFGKALKAIGDEDFQDVDQQGKSIHPTKAETLQLFKARLNACERKAALLPRYWNGIVE